MIKKLLCGLLLCLFLCPAEATDTTPKKTSITLAPHLTELVYSAGGGDTLVGISAYSDYPGDTANKQIIGDAFHLNFELMTTLQPDVVFYWQDGTPQQTIEQLKSRQFNLIGIAIKQLADIPAAIDLIATQLGTQPVPANQQFLPELRRLQQTPHKQQTALIQISDQPIYTVNGAHWMSEAISVCGLTNVFTDLDQLSAAVSLESVVLKKPEVIVSLQSTTADNNPLLQWPSIPAIKNQRLIHLNADHFTRPTLRTLQAIRSLCEQLKS